MARAYKNELAKFSETFNWATETDISTILTVIRSTAQLPLRAIGSGGSLTVAHVLCYFHQVYTRQLTATATPLEAICDPLNSDVAHWLITAGGNNVDILAAARTLIRHEPCQFAALCGRDDSPLAKLCRVHPYTDLLLFPPPTGKDGFLATNSLLGFATLLARAYAMEFDTKEHWEETKGLVRAVVSESSEAGEVWHRQTMPLWERPTTLVLHGPSTRVGAIDLESKFTEAALGNIQFADYRNFAHGRHHWLAKRGHTTSILAFITDADKALAERTLDLLPPEIPQARLTLQGNLSTTPLLSLVAALWISGWAGSSRGIDPGRPGVPDFGRKLYKLALGRTQASRCRVPVRDLVAISRKSGIPMDHLEKGDELEFWETSLDRFRARLREAKFGGLVLDYDGTIVEIRDRFRPPSYEVIDQLIRLLENGIWIGVATGRGTSVGRDLRACLPSSLWQRVLIGYYNGADIAGLEDNDAPERDDALCDSLSAIASAIQSTPELHQWTKPTHRRYQITLEAAYGQSVNRLWETVHQLVLTLGCTNLRVFRSSHSIDVVAPSISKASVISELGHKIGNVPLIAIGDQGRWPGNDCELLQNPHALSVNETSADPQTCWNLAQLGQRGPSVTIDYIKHLHVNDGYVRFSPKALK